MKVFSVLIDLLKGRKIHVFGDSHTEVFNYINKEILRYNKFIVNRVDGATALGMVNPNSKTNALPTFLNTISSLSKKTKLIFLLGEVDVGFLIWHRQDKMNLDIESELNKSIDNYLSFLNNIVSLGFTEVKVLSPPPPSVLDEYAELQKVELRRNVKAGIKQRTDLAIQYNNILRNKLHLSRITFIDLYDELISEKSGIVKDKYLNKDRTEHHLENEEYGKLLIERILFKPLK